MHPICQTSPAVSLDRWKGAPPSAISNMPAAVYAKLSDPVMQRVVSPELLRKR
jgi:hypothetical protein